MRRFFTACLCLLALSPVLGQSTSGTPPAPGGSPASADPAGASTVNPPVSPTSATPSPSPTAAPSTDAKPPADAPRDLFRETLPQDIMTAGYYQLLDWAKSLALDPSGGVSDLRKKLFDYYKLTPPTVTDAAKKSITIDSADAVSYFTLEAADEKYIRITGGVRVTLNDVDKNLTHTVTADQILLNQTTNILTASGKVVYNLIKSDSKETFRGESLTFNLDDWRGIFFDGISQKNRAVGGANLDFSFSGRTIKRSAQDVVILQEGVITSSRFDEPYYHIKAKKIWIFAPGEWGLQDATLYIGRVPVFYFPFFFQPGDEMFFNPVLGGLPTVTDSRGAFLQTTTYFFGEKKKDSSPLSFLQLADGDKTGTKKTVRGLYLVKDTAKRPADARSLEPPKDWVVKLLADVYTNLGFFSGMETNLTNLGPLKKFNLGFGLGLTRNIYASNTPYLVTGTSKDVNYHDSWNTSYVLGSQLPFRFGFKLDLGLDVVNLFLEYYSDPFYRRDFFNNRSENYSMLSVIGFGPKATGETSTETTSLQWRGSSTFNPPVTLLNPWVRSLSVAPFDLVLDWASGVNAAIPLVLNGQTNPNYGIDPASKFFYPTKLTSPRLGLNLSGDLLSLGSAGGPAPGGAPAHDNPETGLKKPWPGEEADSTTKPRADDKTPTSAAEAGPLVPKLPALQPVLANGSTAAASRLTWTYGLSPIFTVENLFDQNRQDATKKWSKPADVDWSVSNSVYSLTNRGNTALSVNLVDSLLTVDDRLDLVLNQQKNFYVAPGFPAASLFQADETGTTTQVAQNLRVGVQPFNFLEQVRGSGVAYTQNLRLYENSYKFTAGTSTPSRQESFPGFDSATFTAHEVTGNLSFNPLPQTAFLVLNGTLRSTLEPRQKETSAMGSLASTLGFLKNTLNLSGKTVKDDWIPDPIQLATELRFSDRVVLSNALTYDWSQYRPQSDSVSFALWALSGRFTAQQGLAQVFDQANRIWINRSTTTEFIPSDTFISLSSPFDKISLWKNRVELSGSLDSSVTFNLQQYTQSSLNFRLSLTMKVMDFLDLTISHQATNRAIYKYFPDLVAGLGPVAAGTAVNPFEDLLNSFDFFNEKHRRESNFKAGILNIHLIHYMKDWTLDLTYTGTPERVQTGTTAQFQWSTNLSMLLSWKPIPEIKAKTEIDKLGNINLKTDQ